MPAKKQPEHKEQPRKSHRHRSHKSDSPRHSKTLSSKGPQSLSSPGHADIPRRKALSKEAALSGEENAGSKDVPAKSPVFDTTERVFPDLACAPESLRVKSHSPGRKASMFRKDSDDELYKHFTKEIDRVTELSKSKMEESQGPGLSSDGKTRRRKDHKEPRTKPEAQNETKGDPGGTKDQGSTPAKLTASAWQKRSKLSVALVAIFAVLLAATFMVYTFLLAPKSTLEFGCISDDCVKFNASLTSLLNLSVDPCDDFYAYVCSRWLMTSNQSYQDDVVNSFYRALSDKILMSTEDEGDRYGMEALVHLYRACYQFMTTDALSLQDMVQISLSFLPYAEMMKSKGLPELGGYLVRIAVNQGVYTTFSVGYLYIGKRLSLHIASETSIQGKIREVFLHVTGHRSGANLSVPHFEDYVGKVLHALYEDSDVEQGVKLLTKWDAQCDALLQTREGSQYIPFKNLANITSAAALEVYMKVINNASLDKLHVTMDDEVYVEGLRQIADTTALGWAHTLKWNCIYYVIHLVTDVVRYAYLRQYVPAAQNGTDRACLMLAAATFRHSWLYSVARLVGSPGDAKRVKAMGDASKDAVILNTEPWMDPFTKAQVSSYIRNVTVFTYQESELWDAVANIDYNEFVHGENDDFVHFFWKVKAYEKTLMYQQIVTQQHVVLSRLQVLARLVYESRYRLLVVPTAFQRPPLYYTGATLPFYVNFATLGTLITRGLIRSGALQLAWSSKTMDKFHTYVACLKSVQESLGLKMQPGADEAAWNRSVFFLTYGSRVAHQGVKTVLQKGQSFQKDWDVAEPIFFIRYCMMFCASRPAPGEPLLPREQCLIPLHSNPSFHDRYNCASRKSSVQSCAASLFM